MSDMRVGRNRFPRRNRCARGASQRARRSRALSSEPVMNIDGSQGEGGGQILRTALALSLVTGMPFRIDNIRARRKRPGLLRQHLTAVQAAVRLGQAEVRGAALGSTRLDFAPGAVMPGAYEFNVGTAGSTTLVLQTVLPALLTAARPSALRFSGGTHNPLAPPFDFLKQTFLPLIARMGPRVTAVLDVPGFYPAGGGQFGITIEPAAALARIDLLRRGDIRRTSARAIIANLPRHIAERELAVVAQELGWAPACLHVEEPARTLGPGNVLLLEIESENTTETVAAFGERGVRAEAVARKAVTEARRYLDAGVPIGEHLADQLLLPIALAGGGSFRTCALSSHARTNIEVLKLFLECEVTVEESGADDCVVTLQGRTPADHLR